MTEATLPDLPAPASPRSTTLRHIRPKKRRQPVTAAALLPRCTMPAPHFPFALKNSAAPATSLFGSFANSPLSVSIAITPDHFAFFISAKSPW